MTLHILDQWDRDLVREGHVELAGSESEDCSRAAGNDRVFDPVKIVRRQSYWDKGLGKLRDAGAAMAAIVEAVTAGQISPNEAAELSRLVESFVKVTEIGELERRLQALEDAAVLSR